MDALLKSSFAAPNVSVEVLPQWLSRLDEAPNTGEVHYSSGSFLQRAFDLQNDGITMSLLTLALTGLLEIYSLDSVLALMRKKGGTRLYAQGVIMNVVNNGFIGPMLYEVVSNHFMSDPLSTWGRVAMIGAVLLGHAIGYYSAHRWMHTRRMYWAHRFHHRFNTIVVPVTANAVSLAEYFIAYMCPFVLGSWILRPDRFSLYIAVGIISLNNLLIHMPTLHKLSEQMVPWWGVSTSDHLEHHKRLTTHYAAPTISIDRLLACVFGKPESWGKKFEDPSLKDE